MTTYELLMQIDLLLGRTVTGGRVWAAVASLQAEEHGPWRFYDDDFVPPSLWERLFNLSPRSPKPKSKPPLSLEETVRAINPREFFISFEALESEIKNIDLDFGPRSEKTIPDLLRRFVLAYELYLRKGAEEHSSLAELAHVASEIKREQNRYEEISTFIKRNLIHGADMPHPQENQRLSLLLKRHLDLPLFLVKLHALDVIYSELCELFKISPKEIPLQIERVESGSLWAKLFGESRVITLMISLVEFTVSYMHRNFTTEGKVAAIPKRLEVLSSELDLEQKLRESGIDTSDLRENIQKASVLISKQLNNLLVGEPVVEINERRHSLGATLEQVYLEQSRHLLIEDKPDKDAFTYLGNNDSDRVGES